MGSDILKNENTSIFSRIPLNLKMFIVIVVVGMNDLALETDLNGEQKEYLEIVKQSATFLLSLLNDILDLSKIEAGKMELEEVEFDINQTVKGAIEIFRGQAYRKNLALYYDIGKEKYR